MYPYTDGSRLPIANPTARDPQDAHLTALLERSKADPDAFAELYTLARSQLRGYVYKRLNGRADPSAVDDIVSETFLRAWRDRERFQRARGAAMQWLLRIAYYRVVDHLLASGLLVQTHRGYDPAPAPVEFAERTRDTSRPNQSAARLREELMAQVREAMAALVPRQRRALELRLDDRMTTDEMAEALGTTGRAVRNLESHARHRLRTLCGAKEVAA